MQTFSRGTVLMYFLHACMCRQHRAGNATARMAQPAHSCCGVLPHTLDSLR